MSEGEREKRELGRFEGPKSANFEEEHGGSVNPVILILVSETSMCILSASAATLS